MSRFIADVDLTIVGGGVSGTAGVMEAACNTNVESIAFLEKYGSVAQVNSNPLANAQTGHRGALETNYTAAHSRKLKNTSAPLYSYVQKRNMVYGLSKKMHSMVLGVGRAECAILKSRYEMLKEDFPDISIIDPSRIAEVEPKVMEGRDPYEEVCALYTEDALAINFQILSKCMLEDALKARPDIQQFFNTEVLRIRKEGDATILTTNKGEIRSKVVVFATGAYSLPFAHELGLAPELETLLLAGDFYDGGNLLNGKVYRPAEEGVPVAQDHGDPDVLNTQKTRFGPTVKPVFQQERGKYSTTWGYLSSPLFRSPAAMFKLVRLLTRQPLFGYIMTNLAYEIPFLGRWLYAKKIRKIIPTIRARDLKKRKGAGGIRPQIFNKVTGELIMGGQMIVGMGCIFIPTPSPGATASIDNGVICTTKVVEILNHQLKSRNQPPKYHYDLAKSRKNLGLPNQLRVA